MFAVLIAATLFGAVALAAESPSIADDSSIADDPRVTDAVQLWSEWVAYQAGSNQIPALSFGIVHDQEVVARGAFG